MTTREAPLWKRRAVHRADGCRMGLSTVEAHLSLVYRKLAVRRVELATRLAHEPGEAVEA
jgi:DNA-binding CsgD family transcriptional regulator